MSCIEEEGGKKAAKISRQLIFFDIADALLRQKTGFIKFELIKFVKFTPPFQTLKRDSRTLGFFLNDALPFCLVTS